MRPAPAPGPITSWGCDRGVGGGAAPSWTPAFNPGWTSINQCPDTGLVASVPPGAVSRGWLENASWDFSVPPGTRLGSLTADIAITRPGSDQWTIAVVGWHDNVLVPEWRHYGCYSQPCGVPSGVRHVTLDLSGMLGIRATAACWGADPCAGGDAGGRIAVRNAHVTVLDDSRPSLSVTGSLWVDAHTCGPTRRASTRPTTWRSAAASGWPA